MPCDHTGRDLRTHLDTPAARALLEAALKRCKLCRWEHTHTASDATIVDLYTAWASHRTQVARIEGATLEGTIPLTRVMGRGSRMFYPPTPRTWELCQVTVQGRHVRVHTGGVMDYVATLPPRERAWVVDDLVDGLIGAEFYPQETLQAFLQRLPA